MQKTRPAPVVLWSYKLKKLLPFFLFVLNSFVNQIECQALEINDEEIIFVNEELIYNTIQINGVVVPSVAYKLAAQIPGEVIIAPYEEGDRFLKRSLLARIDNAQIIRPKLLVDGSSFAPVNGIIIKKYVNVGETVRAGQSLMNIANLESLGVQADVPTTKRLATTINEGDIVRGLLHILLQPEVKVFVNIELKVHYFYLRTDGIKNTITTRFKIPIMPTNIVSPGTLVNIFIPDDTSKKQKLLVIPWSAYKKRCNCVYMINKKGHPEINRISLGHSFGRDGISVLTGLKKGDKILKNGRYFLYKKYFEDLDKKRNMKNSKFFECKDAFYEIRVCD